MARTSSARRQFYKSGRPLPYPGPKYPEHPPPLLGYCLPLNDVAIHQFSRDNLSGQRGRFNNAIQDWAGTPLALRERKMIALVGELIEKPDWQRKVFDKDVVEKWRTEAGAMGFSDRMFDYCITELCDKAAYSRTHGFVASIDASTSVFISDTLIDDDLRQALKSAAAPLEAISDDEKDWHPGSNEQVLDLVHPSLFPLIYGRTRILPQDLVPLDECIQYASSGEIIPEPQDHELENREFATSSDSNDDGHWYSRKFQWLPCEVQFNLEDTRWRNSVKITSYINNLPPTQHKPLYNAIEKFIAKVIPMGNVTLTEAERSWTRPRIRVERPEYVQKVDGPRPQAENEASMTEEEIDELDNEWEKSNRILVEPEPDDYLCRAEYDPGLRWRELPRVWLEEDFAHQGLQVIIKLANIELTPEKPDYAGGSWHVEGQLNEHICATAIYYYDSDNITDSYLAFRETTNKDLVLNKPYPQNDYEYLEHIYGIKQDGPAQQTLGHVSTKEGRLLTFPNVLQHRVEPFKLADPTKPAHRKILALFLVDPFLRIPSTANVPPQQKHWWRRLVNSKDLVAALPPELAEHIVESDADSLIEIDEAKQMRLELMEERKRLDQDVDGMFDTFNFCEH